MPLVWGRRGRSVGARHVTGTYQGNVDFDSSSRINYLLPTAPTTGNSSSFVAKLTSAGQWSWATSIGPANVRGIAVDSSGIYVAGSFSGTFSPSSTLPSALSNGGSDIFVAQLSPNGVFNGMRPLVALGQKFALPSPLTTQTYT